MTKLALTDSTTTAPTKEYHITDVLTITTGRLVSLRHTKGVFDILSFMLGTKLAAHELPDALDKCAPALLEQFPSLSEVTASTLDSTAFRSDDRAVWVSRMENRFGKTLMVRPLRKC